MLISNMHSITIPAEIVVLSIPEEDFKTTFTSFIYRLMITNPFISITPDLACVKLAAI